MDKRLISIEDLAKIKIVGDPQIAPDGKRVIYTVQVTDLEKNKYYSHLWLSGTKIGTEEQFTFGQVRDNFPRWSPDSSRIAFLRTQEKQTQIWLLRADGGEGHALTQLPEGNWADLAWSPDGKCIAFSFRQTHPDWTEEAAKKRGDNGKSSPPRVITHPRYRLDGSGFQDERQHIWVCDAATGETKQITKGDYDDAFPAWAPDGKTIAFVSNRSEDPHRLLYRMDLWLVPSNGGKISRVKTPAGEKSTLAWSPDGERIAYFGAQAGKDPWRPQNDRLWVVSRHGGDARCLSAGLDRSVGNVTLGDTREVAPIMPLWSPDGKQLFFPLSDSGSVDLYSVDVQTARMQRLTRGAIDLAGVSLAADGKTFALLLSTATQPTEVFVGRLLRNRLQVSQLSNQNVKWLQGVQLSCPEEFWLTQPDGTRVQGWVMRPPTMRRGSKHPLLLYVHGGPHAQYGNTFFHELQVHAARGYVVVYSNPRGSNGREEEFGACIHRNWGDLDYQDVMAVADYADGLREVDKNRKAIAGGSYGGYMTNWVVGHTNRFKCAVTDRSLSNFVSMVGTSDEPPPPNSYWPGNPWGDDFRIGWETSPLKYVDQVKTPLLIIHSEGDLRCPVSQAEEWFTALYWLKQQVVFVRYPRETSHGLSRGGPIDLRLDRLQRITEWLDRHLS